MQNHLASNANTIVHLAEYFAELKEAAAKVASQINAIDRGYFTADEDEQVQAILVSYLQSRHAVYDLVNDCRHYHKLPEQQQESTFLVGFAGALVLIDGARFLRELTESHPVVRRKLNQPIPTFRIPGGSYDMIQRSLIRTRHAWHLYNAIRYFEQNEQQLRDFATENSLVDLLQIIDDLQDRADVSLKLFAGTRLRTRSDQAVRRVGRTLIQRSMYGIQKFFSSAMADRYVRLGHEPKLPKQIVDSLSEVARPGDVFIVRKEFALTNYFLPGYWPHAALYLGKREQLTALGIDRNTIDRQCWERIEQLTSTNDRCVLEAMKDGVHLRSWESPLSSDSILVLRPRLDIATIATAITRAIPHVGKRYDFDFDFSRADRLVCTEVIYRAYEGLDNFRFPLVRRAGRPTLSGADLVEMAVASMGFELVALYDGSLAESLNVDKQQVAANVERLLAAAKTAPANPPSKDAAQ